jgi:hypothetical protein
MAFELMQNFFLNHTLTRKYLIFFTSSIILFTSTNLANTARAADPIIPFSNLKSVSVKDNQILDQNGNVIRLLGVNKSGTEYACFQGWGIFDGDFDVNTLKAMQSWGINTVRIPLNSGCWLGRNTGANKNYSGTIYKSAISKIVKLMANQGMIAVLDLHANPPRSGKALKSTQAAPNEDAVAFWRSVAIYFRPQKNIVFDLFNEPMGIDWACWRDGCLLKNGVKSVGMQSLVTEIRMAGSSAPIMIEGKGTATDLSGWELYKPIDELNQLIASNHNYPGMTGNNTLEAWNKNYLPLSTKFPIVTGELGQSDCKHDYVDKYMDWADLNGISYLGWTWNVLSKFWPCKGGHSLITDSKGTPSEHGIGFQNHFLANIHRMDEE